jgi:hypothetical protein
MPHVVLLGDAIFDHATCVARDPHVQSQVQVCLPPGCQTTLLAIDGSRTEDVVPKSNDCRTMPGP